MYYLMIIDLWGTFRDHDGKVETPHNGCYVTDVVSVPVCSQTRVFTIFYFPLSTRDTVGPLHVFFNDYKPMGVM